MICRHRQVFISGSERFYYFLQKRQGKEIESCFDLTFSILNVPIAFTTIKYFTKTYIVNKFE